MPKYKVELELTKTRTVEQEIAAIDPYDAVSTIIEWKQKSGEEVTHWSVVPTEQDKDS